MTAGDTQRRDREARATVGRGSSSLVVRQLYGDYVTQASSSERDRVISRVRTRARGSTWIHQESNDWVIHVGYTGSEASPMATHTLHNDRAPQSPCGLWGNG